MSKARYLLAAALAAVVIGNPDTAAARDTTPGCTTWREIDRATPPGASRAYTEAMIGERGTRLLPGSRSLGLLPYDYALRSYDWFGYTPCTAGALLTLIYRDGVRKLVFWEGPTIVLRSRS